MNYKIGDKITLIKCKHKWLNGLKAEVIELRGNDYVVKSEEGRHIITNKNIAAYCH